MFGFSKKERSENRFKKAVAERKIAMAEIIALESSGLFRKIEESGTDRYNRIGEVRYFIAHEPGYIEKAKTFSSYPDEPWEQYEASVRDCRIYTKILKEEFPWAF